MRDGDLWSAIRLAWQLYHSPELVPVPCPATVRFETSESIGGESGRIEQRLHRLLFTADEHEFINSPPHNTVPRTFQTLLFSAEEPVRDREPVVGPVIDYREVSLRIQWATHYAW